MKERIELKEYWRIREAAKEDAWISVKHFPAQVQDVLYEAGELSEEFRLGWCQEALFLGECDWIYETCFHGEPGRKARLILEGVDTVADVFFNGEKLGSCENFYCPAVFELSGGIKKENKLTVYFRNIFAYLKEQEWKPEWEPAVLKCKTARKPIHDFPPETFEKGSNYQGAVPYFTPVGIYAPVYLEYYEEEEITENWIQGELEENGNGRLKIALAGSGKPDKVKISYQALRTQEACQETLEETITVSLIRDEALEQEPVKEFQRSKDGGSEQEVNHAEKCITERSEQGWRLELEKCIEAPPLWYPRGMGRQELLQVKIELYQGKLQKDCMIKNIGFRKIEMPVPLAFVINQKKVRLFGGSLDPMQGYTHCYQPERAERLFEMVENAHMNTLRIWGEGIPLPDAFYEACDQRGILVWQEFFLGHGAYPESEKLRKACIQEAEVLIKRLRHHPCILLWCGGNETIMGAEFAGVPAFGSSLALEEFPKLVQKLDTRYYHPNSPFGGAWANDPREGDFHTYDCVWEYPYQDYPNFISEHIRTSPPVLHSLQKMIHGPVWEKESQQNLGDAIMPENWLERTHLGAQGQRKTGAYWEFYEADNIEGFLYKFGASYGKEIRRYGEQVRIGSREPSDFLQRSKGYFACKLVDTWPKIYCAPIDFFQEAYIPYYTLKHIFTPILLCFQKEESIRLWGVNDSKECVEKWVEFGLMDLKTEQFVQKKRKKVCMEQGEAALIYDFAEFQFFSKDCILFAKLYGEQEEFTCIDYVDLERHLHFGDAMLDVQIEGNELVIHAEHFARCVEITGEQEGNPFGYLFTDNYFDMLPGQTRRIQILGTRKWGNIYIKPHYGKRKEVFWKPGEPESRKKQITKACFKEGEDEANLFT